MTPERVYAYLVEANPVPDPEAMLELAQAEPSLHASESRSDTMQADERYETITEPAEQGRSLRMKVAVTAAAVVIAVGGAVVLTSQTGVDEPELLAPTSPGDVGSQTEVDEPELLAAKRGELTDRNRVDPGLYELDALPGTVVELAVTAELPDGWAYTSQLAHGDLAREIFLPGADTQEAFAEIVTRYHEPREGAGSDLLENPVVELVRLPNLGEPAGDVAAAIVTTPGVEVVAGPDPVELGGASGVVLDLTTTERVVIGFSDAADFGNKVAYYYPEGRRLRMWVLDTALGPIIVSATTDTTGFEAWLPVATAVIERITFPPSE